jgi:hypothetical protein
MNPMTKLRIRRIALAILGVRGRERNTCYKCVNVFDDNWRPCRTTEQRDKCPFWQKAGGKGSGSGVKPRD